MKRFRKNNKFTVGDRVRLSKRGRDVLPRHNPDRLGVVVGMARGLPDVSRVHWDGHAASTAQSLHNDFLDLVPFEEASNPELTDTERYVLEQVKGKFRERYESTPLRMALTALVGRVLYRVKEKCKLRADSTQEELASSLVEANRMLDERLKPYGLKVSIEMRRKDGDLATDLAIRIEEAD